VNICGKCKSGNSVKKEEQKKKENEKGCEKDIIIGKKQRGPKIKQGSGTEEN
jgi:hypothetical protein